MKKKPCSIRKWVSGTFDVDVQQSVQQWSRRTGVSRIAVMPDVHLAKNVCIGTVIATDKVLYPAAVGGDIGCGILAVAMDCDAEAFRAKANAARLLGQLNERVPTNRLAPHRITKRLPSELEDQELSDPRLQKLKLREGCVQLGTLGRGNHFVEFQYDEDDRLWLMIHSGSRGIGQAIAKHHGCEKRKGIAADSDAGQAYFSDMQWARAYARCNRLAMMQSVTEILSSYWNVNPDLDTVVHTDHNHVQVENHSGKPLLVHRKGAQQLPRDELGLVPGSMGSGSFIVSGKGCEAALDSCAHGAGRKMSRQQAKRSVSLSGFEESMQNVWFNHQKTKQLLDEAPQAYKDLDQVMRDQRELVRPVRRLFPLINFKGT